MENQRKKISEYSIKELRDVCQKYRGADAYKKKSDNPVGVFSLNFSIYFTRLFLYTKITPNQITVISVLVFYIGVVLFLFNDHGLNILGSLIIFFSIVLDGCDGEVARFRKKISRTGLVYVEPVSHDVQYGFAFLIVAHGLVINGFPPYYYILGAVAGISKLLFRLLQDRFCAYLRSAQISCEQTADMHKTLKKKSAIRAAYKINKNLFNNSGVFSVLFFCALINRIDLALWFFGIGYTLLWLAMFGKQVYQINRGGIK